MNTYGPLSTKAQFNSEQFLSELFESAKEYFCNGIYVLSDQHPCGWDFISFENFEAESDLWKEPILDSDISNGCYILSNFENMTVQDVMNEVGPEGWCFEISGVDFLH